MYVRVCGTSDLVDGEASKFEVDNRWVLIARAGSLFFASDPSCTHEEADLSLGILADSVVTCPLHHARFDLRTGDVLEGPNGDDPSTIPALRVYKTKVERDSVLVEF